MDMAINITGSLASILAFVWAVLAWKQSKKVAKKMEFEKNRLNKKIKVTLQHGGDKRELPIKLRRTDVTRAEVLGRLGMVPMKENGKRFSLSYLNTSEFLDAIVKITENDGDDHLLIPCNEGEFYQFAWEKTG